MKYFDYAQIIASELGYIKATFIGNDEMGCYYSLVVSDEEYPTPTGLPTVIAIHKQDEYTIYDGIDALDMLSRFDKS